MKLLPYKVGALMYVPATKTGVGEKLCTQSIEWLDSVSFCLEDAIVESGVESAEKQLIKTLSYIDNQRPNNLPLLFVRVRNCQQFERLPSLLGNLTNLLTGFILPKFDLSNAAEYCSITGKINSCRITPLYIMPILESASIMNLESRKRTLLGLRELVDGCKDYILNIRVGAMDFCKLHGLRRSVCQSIYDIAVVRDVLTDILTVFADNYVVSAPVWEYFQGHSNDSRWEKGLENELRLDATNGFIGKTVIHPSQLPIVRRWLRPSRVDFDDARAIMGWQDRTLGVAKSTEGNRMNELATHVKWAEKILMMAKVYGIRDD